MTVHAIIGWVAIVAALVIIGGLVIIVSAAAKFLGRQSGPQIPGHIFEIPSRRLSPEQRSLESAQCFWDCMSGLHWDEDWAERCTSACGLTEKPKKVSHVDAQRVRGNRLD